MSESLTLRNLYVVFDKHPTWDSHISALNKCSGMLIGLSHVRHLISGGGYEQCPGPFARPSTVVAWRMLYNAPQIPNFAQRVVPGRRKFDQVSDVRQELGWLLHVSCTVQTASSLLHKLLNTGELSGRYRGGGGLWPVHWLVRRKIFKEIRPKIEKGSFGNKADEIRGLLKNGYTHVISEECEHLSDDSASVHVQAIAFFDSQPMTFLNLPS